MGKESESLHKPIDLHIAFTLETSSGPCNFPALASSMAAFVSASGIKLLGLFGFGGFDLFGTSGVFEGLVWIGLASFVGFVVF